MINLDHTPVWCQRCSPRALRVANLDQAENWLGNWWVYCEECRNMCDTCYNVMRSTKRSQPGITYQSWEAFIACLMTAAPEGATFVQDTSVSTELRMYRVAYPTEPVELDSADMDTVHFEGGGYRESDSRREQPQLLWPLDVPYDEQFLTRMAQVMGDGAHKYEARNWERFEDSATLERAKASASRHFNAWLSGDESEDHAAAAAINLLFAETIKYKIANKE